MAKVICIITARNSSSRLKNKALLKIGNKTVLQRVIDRVKAVNLLAKKELINKIIIAVPFSKPNYSLVKWCEKNLIRVWRLANITENDVLSRVYECARVNQADYILRITADCPFLSPEILAAFLMKCSNYQYQALAVNRGKIWDGTDAEIISIKLLQLACRYAKGDEREHITKWIRKHLNKYQDDLDISLEDLDFSFLKTSLDTKKDLEFLRRYEKLL